MPLASRIFERQWLHGLGLALLSLLPIFAGRLENVRQGELWGIRTPVWMWAAILVAVAHQLLVWFCWRTELHTKLLTRTFGERSFVLYAVAFWILFVGRGILVYLLAVANQGTSPLPDTVGRTLAVLLLVPCLYLFYSVRRYFGLRRALGIDHFDESYRSMTLVRQGIFRFTRNGMYVFGFLILWVLALWHGSSAALVVAAFQHAYIWIHYYATELPDIRRIYEAS